MADIIITDASGRRFAATTEELEIVAEGGTLDTLTTPDREMSGPLCLDSSSVTTWPLRGFGDLLTYPVHDLGLTFYRPRRPGAWYDWRRPIRYPHQPPQDPHPNAGQRLDSGDDRKARQRRQRQARRNRRNKRGHR
jgi:hypothetical protein